MTADSPDVYIGARIVIGLSLATFVTCQVWCSQFFDRSIVGTVNATAGGWGNVGGGFTLLLMPQIIKGMLNATNDDINASWRICFIIPLVMHLVSSIFIMSGRDLPDGSYNEIEKSGAKQKSKGAGNVALLGFTNTNAWILLIGYAFCFGVELTMNNKLVTYFERYYAMENDIAGPIGATFSLMNLFARSWGGILSDYLAAKKGLPGRIFGMWVCQVGAGVMCIVLGLITTRYDSPDEPKFSGLPKVNSTWEDEWGNEWLFPQANLRVKPCASVLQRTPEYAIYEGAMTKMPMSPARSSSCATRRRTASTPRTPFRPPSWSSASFQSSCRCRRVFTLASCHTCRAQRLASFLAWSAPAATPAPSSLASSSLARVLISHSTRVSFASAV